MESRQVETSVLTAQSSDVFVTGTQDNTRWSRTISQLLAATSALLGVMSFGFHNGWSSPSLAKLLAADSDIPVTSSQGAWIVGFMPLGGASGLFIGIFLGDKLGRKTVILLSSIPYLVGSVLIAFAVDYRWLYIARFIIGTGCGISIAIGTTYVSEIAEDKLRGVLGTLVNNAASFGVVIAYCIGPWVDRQYFAVVSAALPVISVLAFIRMPETPYFLIMKKKFREAERSLAWLRGRADVANELKIIELNVEIDQRNQATWKELVATPLNRRALLIGIGLMLAQEFSGIAVVNAYSALVFQAAGTRLSTNVSLIITAMMQFLAGLLAIFVSNLARRRTMLLISTLGSIISLSSEALYFQLQVTGIDVSSIFWLPITAIVGYIISYSVGLGVLPASIYAEVFPCNVRAIGLMAVEMFAAVGMISSVKIYQIIADNYGIQYGFWFFAVATICSTIFIYFLVPETKNRSIRDIHDHLRIITGSKSASTVSKNSSESSKLMPIGVHSESIASYFVMWNDQ